MLINGKDLVFMVSVVCKSPHVGGKNVSGCKEHPN